MGLEAEVLAALGLGVFQPASYVCPPTKCFMGAARRCRRHRLSSRRKALQLKLMAPCVRSGAEVFIARPFCDPFFDYHYYTQAWKNRFSFTLHHHLVQEVPKKYQFFPSTYHDDMSIASRFLETSPVPIKHFYCPILPPHLGASGFRKNSKKTSPLPNVTQSTSSLWLQQVMARVTRTSIFITTTRSKHDTTHLSPSRFGAPRTRSYVTT